MPLPFSAEALLEAIDGIAYLVDGDGIILGFSGGPLPPMANAGGAPSDIGNCVGTNLFAHVGGPEVIASYRALHQAVWSRGQLAIGFEYRCDAPERERHMRMSLSLIQVDGTPRAVLYQSTVITETHRVPLPLFAADLLTGRGSPSPDDVLVRLCSYCQRVAWPVGVTETAPEWIEAAEFYRRGGGSHIAISHAVCAPCLARVMALVPESAAG